MGERLQKILAHAGVASRRQAEELIEQGRVRVNGHVVQEMGVRADPRADTITVDGQRIQKIRKFTYMLLNKPRNVMSTVSDPEGRPTVIDIVGKHAGTRLYPVGRLDFGSEGLLILSNDGDFTRFMTRAGGAAKVYGVKVSGVPSARTLDRLRRGVRIEGRSYAPCEIRTVSEEANSWYEVTLHEGQNRQLRKMFEAVGHRVMRLRRTRIGFLTAPMLSPGKWRHLTAHEVQEFYRRYGGASVSVDSLPNERHRGSGPARTESQRDKRRIGPRPTGTESQGDKRRTGRRPARTESQGDKRWTGPRPTGTESQGDKRRIGPRRPKAQSGRDKRRAGSKPREQSRGNKRGSGGGR